MSSEQLRQWVSANAQPRSVSLMALSAETMAAARQPPLSCSAFASDARAPRNWPNAAAMFGWSWQTPAASASVFPAENATAAMAARAIDFQRFMFSVFLPAAGTLARAEP